MKWRSGGEGSMQGAKSIKNRCTSLVRQQRRSLQQRASRMAGGFAHSTSNPPYSWARHRQAPPQAAASALCIGTRRRRRSFPGLNTESSYILVLPQATATVTGITTPGGFTPIPPGTPGSSSGNVGIDARIRAPAYGSLSGFEGLLAWHGDQLAVRLGDEAREYDPTRVHSWPDDQT